MCAAPGSLFDTFVSTWAPRSTRTQASLLQAPGTVAAGHLGSGACRVPPSTRPHTAAESPAHTHTPPRCHPAYPVASVCPLHLGYVSPEEEEAPREVFSLSVLGPSVRSGTLRILEIVCVPGPWPLGTVSVRTIPFGSAWSGTESPHTTSRRVDTFSDRH